MMRPSQSIQTRVDQLESEFLSGGTQKSAPTILGLENPHETHIK